MSTWSDMEDRGIGDSVKKEDYITEKKYLAEALVDTANKGCGDLAEILKGLEKRISLSDDAFQIKIEDDHRLLIDDEKLLLQASLILPFQLWSYKSLEQLLAEQEVHVIIDSSRPEREIPSDLQKTKSLWEEMARENPDDPFAKMMKEKVFGEIENWKSMIVLGRYVRREKSIYLYPNNMKEVDKGDEMSQLLVTTLVHEVMHAYFDRIPLDAFPYVYTVEEPMAEFGMLLYLKETNLTEYYTWAKEKVGSKLTCYRYGVAMMDQCEREGKISQTRKDLELYKVIWPSKSGLSKPKTARGTLTNKQIADSIKAYLFDGMSFRDIERSYLGMPKRTNGGGWAARKLLESRGIDSSMKKMFMGKTVAIAIGMSAEPLKSTLVWMDENL